MTDFTYICGGRSTGKTRKLLELAKEKNAIVICKNPTAMRYKAEAYGSIGLDFIGYENAFENIHEDCGSLGDFVVDEARDLMEFMFASNCIGLTQTEGD